MEGKDYKKINELLKSSIRGLDGNTTAYINSMLKEAQRKQLSSLCGRNIITEVQLEEELETLNWIKKENGKSRIINKIKKRISNWGVFKISNSWND